MLARIAVGALLVLAAPARAAPTVESKSEPRWSLLVRPDCERFVPPMPEEHPMHWDRWLSLASCVQDASRAAVDDPFEVPEMFAGLSIALMPAMLMWRDAIGYGPHKIQVHAAYHVGLAAVALMTRARASLATGPREAVLRQRLERLLTPSKDLAWTAFTAVVTDAAQHPAFEHDPVNRAMLASARRMLEVLERPVAPQVQLADHR